VEADRDKIKIPYITASARAAEMSEIGFQRRQVIRLDNTSGNMSMALLKISPLDINGKSSSNSRKLDLKRLGASPFRGMRSCTVQTR